MWVELLASCVTHQSSYTAKLAARLAAFGGGVEKKKDPKGSPKKASIHKKRFQAAAKKVVMDAQMRRMMKDETTINALHTESLMY